MIVGLPSSPFAMGSMTIIAGLTHLAASVARVPIRAARAAAWAAAPLGIALAALLSAAHVCSYFAAWVLERIFCAAATATYFGAIQ